MKNLREFDNDEDPTCNDSVGPKTYDEAVARGMHRPPFNFTPEDFEHRPEQHVEETRPPPSL